MIKTIARSNALAKRTIINTPVRLLVAIVDKWTEYNYEIRAM